MYLTKEMLMERHACWKQVDLFAATFPEGVLVTEAVCIAVAGQFDFRWAACLLPVTQRTWYRAQLKQIYAGYLPAFENIRAQYRREQSPYNCAAVKKFDEFCAELARLDAEHWTNCAPLFGRIAETV